MALFEVFRGPEPQLNRIPLHEGYAYFCEDTGNFFVDIGNNPGDRQQINAYYAKALKNGTVELDINAIQSGINAATTKAYTASLATSGWQSSNGKFTYIYTNANLKCGKEGNVPPIITYTSNLEEYSKIEKAEADSGVGITFTTAEKPSANIGIIIIDIQ